MIEVEGRIRKWGRSLKGEGLKENQRVRMLIAKKENVLRETFGTMSFKKTTEEMLKESDRELYDA